MADRVAQDRLSIGCLWALAIGWAALALLSSRCGDYEHSAIYDEIFVGALVLGAIYLMIDRRRFPAATLVVDAPPIPGHAFRGKVETPLKSEPPSGIRVRVRATRYVRKPGTSTVWRTAFDAHPMRGEHGIIVPVEVTIPAELPNDLDWDVTVRALVPFGLYRARFVVRTPR